MNRMTKAQKLALRAIYNRAPLYRQNMGHDHKGNDGIYALRSLPSRWRNERLPCCQYHEATGQTLGPCWNHHAQPSPMSYLAFRRSAFVGSDCVMVPWLNMWLGIEADGYTHS